MGIRIITIDQVNFIERESDKRFWEIIDSSRIELQKFLGWLQARYPGRYLSFERNTNLDHRTMYEDCDFRMEAGDFRVEGNAYVDSILAYVNEYEHLNDDVWNTIENEVDIDEYYRELMQEEEE